MVTTDCSGVENLVFFEGYLCFQQITDPLVQGQCLELSAKPLPSLCLQELDVSFMWFEKQVDRLTSATQYWSIYRAGNAYNLFKHLENAEVQILIWRDKQLFSLGRG